ncbi:MAG: DUF2063 domain-containing protein [Parvibaculaceae bacterium]
MTLRGNTRACFERRFAAALLDHALPVPDGVTSREGSRSERRFGVYRANVSAALVEALAVRYPVVKRLVGQKFFRAMARDYALKNLPRSPVLIRYGGDYPEFIEGFGPAGSLPYLADVARLESAWWETYHAADAEPLPPAAFEAVPETRLADVRLAFVPAMRLLSSRFPVVSIWRTNTEDETVAPVDLAEPEDALVARPEMEVEVRRLPPGGYTFLAALRDGHSLGQAASDAMEADKRFNLADNLAGLIRSRIAAEILA